MEHTRLYFMNPILSYSLRAIINSKSDWKFSSGKFQGNEARPAFANLARIIMYKGDDGGGWRWRCGSGSPLKIRLNINELSLPLRRSTFVRGRVHALLQIMSAACVSAKRVEKCVNV